MWSTDQRTWAKVQSNSPSTTVDSDDELEWDVDDDTIDNIKIQFAKGNIISNGSVRGNNSKKVQAQVPNGVARNLTDSYTIKVKPANGGAVGEYDPDVKTPENG
jgi:hypothetical protein